MLENDDCFDSMSHLQGVWGSAGDTADTNSQWRGCYYQIHRTHIYHS